jgi:hypothetical protein
MKSIHIISTDAAKVLTVLRSINRLAKTLGADENSLYQAVFDDGQILLVTHLTKDGKQPLSAYDLAECFRLKGFPVTEDDVELAYCGRQLVWDEEQQKTVETAPTRISIRPVLVGKNANFPFAF